jgi:hypothetical protein
MKSILLRKWAVRSVSAAVLVTGLCSALAGNVHNIVHRMLIITTPKDFHQPGTQPNTLSEPVIPSDNCSGCHGYYDPNQEPYTRWSTSMMAQATRDPVFHAALAIANQDAKDSGELCLRCHAPGAWLDGRSTPTDGSGLNQALGDFDGVTCNLCHRLVDPINEPENPPADAGILSALAEQPVNSGGGQYIIDPHDIRRGPFELSPSFFYHDWAKSPFHEESLLCATCHDVSNPVFTRQPDGTYALNDFDAPHPTQNKFDEFPVERTYSEWSKSTFAQVAIDMGGRFGGNTVEVSSCQDCHIPTTTGTACNPGLGGAVRDDLPLHDFNGANIWVLDAVRSLYPDIQTGLNDASVAAAHQRTEALLHNAADLYAASENGDLAVRIVNQSGHKLPTGYGEGRRMWINVEFRDALNNVIDERGAYDTVSATLTTGDTRVYEAQQGLDGAMANLTGLPAAASFHFVLNNLVYKDNRIPPRGFTNAAFESVQAAPVAAAYGEEHYWDDTHFAVPLRAVSATVRLYHQTTSREYIEFLHDNNHTNQAGQVAYDQWVAHGKSAPVLMSGVTLDLTQPSSLTPIPYGLAKTGSNSLVPSLSYQGVPSEGAANFMLHVTQGIPGQSGVILESTASASTRYYGGTKFVADPTTQAASYTLDGNGEALIPITISPAMVGTTRYYQAVFDDPSLPQPYGLSNGLVVDYGL